MDTRLAESFFPSPRDCPRVAGRRLRPYSLWHSMQLTAFAGEDEPAAYAQLALVAGICATAYPRLHRPPRGLALRIDRVRVGYYTRRPRALLAEIEKYVAYRATWTAGPRFWRSDKPGSTAKTPWQLFLAARLVRHGGFTWAAAWDMPLGRALWLATALAEVGGAKINLLTEADEAALRAAGHDPEDFA